MTCLCSHTIYIYIFVCNRIDLFSRVCGFLIFYISFLHDVYLFSRDFKIWHLVFRDIPPPPRAPPIFLRIVRMCICFPTLCFVFTFSQIFTVCTFLLIFTYDFYIVPPQVMNVFLLLLLFTYPFFEGVFLSLCDFLFTCDSFRFFHSSKSAIGMQMEWISFRSV